MLTEVQTMNVAETLGKAFDFQVIKAGLVGPDGVPTPHFGLFKVPNNGGKWQSVGRAVKKNYHPHTLDDITTQVEAACDVFGGTCNLTTYWNGSAHCVTVAPTAEFGRQIFGSTDRIFPRLIIKAGYDGKCFHAWLGMYRFVCQNLSIVRQTGYGVEARIRHCANLRSKLSDVRFAFDKLVSQWDKVYETAQDMERKILSVDAYLAQVYPLVGEQSPRTLKAAEDRARAIVSRILRERQQIKGGMGDVTRATAWELYNGVQGFVQHDLARRGQEHSKVSRAILALTDKNVARALELAIAG
jgi:hypothetical protein